MAARSIPTTYLDLFKCIQDDAEYIQQHPNEKFDTLKQALFEMGEYIGRFLIMTSKSSGSQAYEQVSKVNQEIAHFDGTDGPEIGQLSRRAASAVQQLFLFRSAQAESRATKPSTKWVRFTFDQEQKNDGSIAFELLKTALSRDAMALKNAFQNPDVINLTDQQKIDLMRLGSGSPLFKDLLLHPTFSTLIGEKELFAYFQEILQNQKWNDALAIITYCLVYKTLGVDRLLQLGELMATAPEELTKRHAEVVTQALELTDAYKVLGDEYLS